MQNLILKNKFHLSQMTQSWKLWFNLSLPWENLLCNLDRIVQFQLTMQCQIQTNWMFQGPVTWGSQPLGAIKSIGLYLRSIQLWTKKILGQIFLSLVKQDLHFVILETEYLSWRYIQHILKSLNRFGRLQINGILCGVYRLYLFLSFSLIYLNNWITRLFMIEFFIFILQYT